MARTIVDTEYRVTSSFLGKVPEDPDWPARVAFMYGPNPDDEESFRAFINHQWSEAQKFGRNVIVVMARPERCREPGYDATSSGGPTGGLRRQVPLVMKAGLYDPCLRGGQPTPPDEPDWEPVFQCAADGKTHIATTFHRCRGCPPSCTQKERPEIRVVDLRGGQPASPPVGIVFRNMRPEEAARAATEAAESAAAAPPEMS